MSKTAATTKPTNRKQTHKTAKPKHTAQRSGKNKTAKKKSANNMCALDAVAKVLNSANLREIQQKQDMSRFRKVARGKFELA